MSFRETFNCVGTFCHMDVIEEIKEASEESAELIQRIAASGDVDGYMKCKSDVERCQAEIEVKKAVLIKADTPVSIEDVKEAWSEYYDAAGKERSKALAELHKTEQLLLDQFRRITNINLDMQRRLCRCCEIGSVEMQASKYLYGGTFSYRPEGEKELAAISEFYRVLLANEAIKDFDAGQKMSPQQFRVVNDGTSAGMRIESLAINNGF